MVVMSCDLPARALTLNMRQFNGKHGCHLCEDPGENSSLNPLLRWWPYNGEIVLRTKQSMLKSSVDVALQDEIVSSVFLLPCHAGFHTAIPPLSKIPPFYTLRARA